MYTSAHSNQDDQNAVGAYTGAIGLDPNYALAYAARSSALSDYAGHTSAADVRESFEKALTDARKALALAPDLAEGHVAMETYLELGALDFARAMEEFERALALAPGNASVLASYSVTAVLMGRTEAGIAAGRRAVVLDPLSRDAHRTLANALYFARQYKEAIAASQEALALDPEDAYTYATRGLASYALRDFEDARASCESKADNYLCQMTLAVTYDKLGRHADAETQLRRMQASFGDNNAYQYAAIYAQWGNVPKALEWLEKAQRLRDPGLSTLKAESLFDPLRQEPRFRAIERQLKFPN
jgi:tetratricopeptide (TPR) repeat protein